MRRAEELSADTLRPTVPVCAVSTTGVPELVGTALLLDVTGCRLLVTAGHILDFASGAALGVGHEVGLMPIEGKPLRLRTPGARSADQDRIDVAVFRLESPEWATLDGGCFAGLEELDLVPPIVQKHTYALIGFPVTMNRRATPVNARIAMAAYRVAGLECDSAAYSEEGHDPSAHVMIGFEKKSTLSDRGIVTAPNLEGMSGSGIWRFGRYLRQAQRPPALSALFTEWHRRARNKYVLGTRMSVILAAIAERHEDLRIPIEGAFRQQAGTP